MTTRREFPRKIRAAIIHRATGEDGQVRCEGCGLMLGKKPFEVDHTIAEALILDKSRKLTADDGKLLGRECCHKPKTKDDVRRVRKSDRARDKHTGAKRPKQTLKSRGFAPSEKAEKRMSKPALPPRQLFKEG